MSTIKLENIQTRTGSGTITIGASGETVALGSGVTTSGFATTNGITMADSWRLTADVTSNGDITSNLERNDSTGSSKIGTGMSESSGVFSFPSTGLYLVRFNVYGEAIADDNVFGYIMVTTDNSSYTLVASGTFSGDDSSTGNGSGMTETFVNVTNTSTHKVKFQSASITAGSSISGNTTANTSFMTFIRLGDSQ